MVVSSGHNGRTLRRSACRTRCSDANSLMAPRSNAAASRDSTTAPPYTAYGKLTSSLPASGVRTRNNGSTPTILSA